MNALKILQVCSSRAWGGMEMQVVHVSSALKERGHSITVLCYPGSPLFSASHRRGIPCKTMSLDSYVRPFHIFRLASYVKEYGFDILHCHYSKDLWSLIPAVGLAGKGNVILSKGIGPGKRKADPLHTWMYKRVKRVIAKSEYLHSRVIEAYPVDPGRVVTLHNGVDLKFFNPILHNGERVRKEFSVAPEERLVGMVGRISPAKGHKEFLQAASHVREVLPETKFLIAGAASRDEVWYEQEVRQWAVEVGLDGHVIFTGFREDVPAILSALDLFVLTSHIESFGNTLVEAMAMGKACVATAAGGVLDIVENGVSGLLVPAQDVQSLTEAMVFLLNDDQGRNKLGYAARKRIEEKFNLNYIVARLEEIYLQVMDREKLAA